MKQIPLTHGLFALVDDEDFDSLSRLSWHAHKGKHTYYARTDVKQPDGSFRGRTMHRCILGLTDSKVKTDHKNGNGLDNQRENIRVATNSQNGANQKKPVGASSRFKGVHLQQFSQRWVATIGQNQKKFFLGIFDSEVEAAKTYDAAATERFGEFAKLNFPL